MTAGVIVSLSLSPIKKGAIDVLQEEWYPLSDTSRPSWSSSLPSSISTSDHDLHSRLLLAKGHGYPLSHPQPSDDLPPESRARGIEIGDIGVLTSDGGFDTFFNICRARDDAVNRFGVPTGFEAVHLDPADVLSRRLYHRPGSHVSNTRIIKRRLDVNTDLDNVFSPAGAGAVVEISTVSKQAAVLLMPEGASRMNLRFLDIFRQQALKHAQQWYAFLKDLGCMVENGELYLVTGVDKASSWIVGAVENQSQDCSISLKLKAAQIGSAGGSYTWQWETGGAFADSGPRRLPGEDPSAQNQTVFLRGFRIALHSLAWRKISQAIPVVDSKRLTLFSKRWFTSFVQSQPRGSRSVASSGRTAALHDESDMVEYSPATTRPYHPADVINEHLLRSSPEKINVVVTHDDEWTAALNNDDETVPADSELIRRFCDRSTVKIISDGPYVQSSNAIVDTSPKISVLAAMVVMFICVLLAMGPSLERGVDKVRYGLGSRNFPANPELELEPQIRFPKLLHPESQVLFGAAKRSEEESN
ncbi:Tkl tkl-ccin protein kinase [Mycena venus]|uniref:Tkl tkl-ccin protein kinase n=1 Tax=Mycena venus TaxID=2733690 RepID=A0A8H7CUM7_9AGAR|nr:Tkl tkl-ccin protein kinase [Mycena venus]